MQPTLIPCEIYCSRADAIGALATDLVLQAVEIPSALLPPLMMEDVRGVTCLAYDYHAWTDCVAALQPALRSLVMDLGRHRVVLDFTGQSIVGTPTMACIYSLWKTLSTVGACAPRHLTQHVNLTNHQQSKSYYDCPRPQRLTPCLAGAARARGATDG